MTAVYRVLAKRWDGGWELHVDGVGVTQALEPSEAEEMVRDLIALRKDVPADSFDLEWSADSPGFRPQTSAVA